MLCGDGKVATVTLDDQGQVADRQLSDKLFDADQDAWFNTAERIGDRFFFISFKGTLTELDLSGPAAKVLGSRPIAGTPQDAKRGWRPGGYQAFAVHPGGKVAVVSMHEGGREGSHKLPAKQLWVVDLATGKKLAAHPWPQHRIAHLQQERPAAAGARRRDRGAQRLGLGRRRQAEEGVHRPARRPGRAAPRIP
jgi:methylamine dehydrogenase heavy chain